MNLAEQLDLLIRSQDGARLTVERSHIHRQGTGRIVGCDPHPCTRPDGHVRRHRIALPSHGSNGGALYFSAWEPDDD